MKTASSLMQSALSAVILMGTSSAFASLQQYHDPTAPSGAQINNITFDTATGLEWLDWDATRNISFTTILENNGPGQIYEGWTFATRDQVQTLLFNIGLNVANWPGPTYVADGGDGLNLAESYLGERLRHNRIDANTADLVAPDILGDDVPYIVAVWHFERYFGQESGTLVSAGYANLDDGFSGGIGNALIRRPAVPIQEPAVPEATSIGIWLLLSGFAVTFSSRAQRQSN